MDLEALANFGWREALVAIIAILVLYVVVVFLRLRRLRRAKRYARDAGVSRATRERLRGRVPFLG